MRELDWNGVLNTLDTPNIGKTMEMKGELESTWDDKMANTKKSCMKTKFLSVFQLKRSKPASNPSIGLAKPKVMIYDDNKPPRPVMVPRIQHSEFENYLKQDVRPTKSMPPQQAHLYSQMDEMSYQPVMVSVATQTDHHQPRHMKLSRSGTTEESISRTRMWVEGLGFCQQPPYYGIKDENKSNIRNKTREELKTNQDNDKEVSEALSRGCKALQDAIIYKQRADIRFNSTSDVVCPTTDIDTIEDDETSDSDESDEDDDSFNIYEEALNVEDYSYKEYTSHPSHTRLQNNPPSVYHSYSALPPKQAVIEKKKLMRTRKSNPPSLQLSQKRQIPMKSEEAFISKVQNLKKSLSSKFSIFNSKNS